MSLVRTVQSTKAPPKFNLLPPLPEHDNTITVIKFSKKSIDSDRKSTYVAIGDVNGSLAIHESQPNRLVRHKALVKLPQSPLLALAWHPKDDRELLVGFENGSVVGYQFDYSSLDTGHKDLSWHARYPGQPIRAIAINPVGKQFAIVHGKRVSTYSRQAFGEHILNEFALAHDSDPVAVCYWGNDHLIVGFANARPNIRVMHAAHPTTVYSLSTGQADLSSLTLSPRGDILVASDLAGSLHIFHFPPPNSLTATPWFTIPARTPSYNVAVDVVFLNNTTALVGTDQAALKLINLPQDDGMEAVWNSLEVSTGGTSKLAHFDASLLADGELHIIAGSSDPRHRLGYVFHLVRAKRTLRPWSLTIISFGLLAMISAAGYRFWFPPSTSSLAGIRDVHDSSKVVTPASLALMLVSSSVYRWRSIQLGSVAIALLSAFFFFKRPDMPYAWMIVIQYGTIGIVTLHLAYSTRVRGWRAIPPILLSSIALSAVLWPNLPSNISGLWRLLPSNISGLWRLLPSNISGLWRLLPFFAVRASRPLVTLGELPMASRVVESPMASLIVESPISLIVGSPMASLEVESPTVSLVVESPMASLEVESPISLIVGSPMAPLDVESPTVSLVVESPMASLEVESPTVSLVVESPMASLEVESPTVSLVVESPTVSLDVESPMASLEVESPTVSLVVKSPMASLDSLEVESPTILVTGSSATSTITQPSNTVQPSTIVQPSHSTTSFSDYMVSGSFILMFGAAIYALSRWNTRPFDERQFRLSELVRDVDDPAPGSHGGPHDESDLAQRSSHDPDVVGPVLATAHISERPADPQDAADDEPTRLVLEHTQDGKVDAPDTNKGKVVEGIDVVHE